MRSGLPWFQYRCSKSLSKGALAKKDFDIKALCAAWNDIDFQTVPTSPEKSFQKPIATKKQSEIITKQNQTLLLFAIHNAAPPLPLCKWLINRHTRKHELWFDLENEQVEATVNIIDEQVRCSRVVQSKGRDKINRLGASPIKRSPTQPKINNSQSFSCHDKTTTKVQSMDTRKVVHRTMTWRRGREESPW